MKKLEKESDIAIKVDHVSKTFRIPHEKITSLRGAAVSLFKKKTYEEFKALDDVSFEVKKGEFFGIIGRNGSGKSTLLKILAGIYKADKGKVKTYGMISPFLELGIGFNPELSGRDNIYLNATVLGMTKKQIDKKFDDIVKFSELERFIDQKLKNYSSGMQVRLAFSVSIHANRDILLMDEVLAVGDSNFQSKCLEEFENYKKDKKTVILVSHDILAVEKYCDRIMFLNSGKVVDVGNPKHVIYEYKKLNYKQEEANIKLKNELINETKKRWGTRDVVIDKIDILDPDDNHIVAIKTGDDIKIRVSFSVIKNINNLNFGVAIYRKNDNLYCYDINTDLDKLDIKNKKINKGGVFEIIFKNVPLIGGEYYLKVGIFGDYTKYTYDFFDYGPEFRIIGRDKDFGAVFIDHTWNFYNIK